MQFSEFARENGLLLDHAIPDGRVHRVKTEGHERKRNGSYRWDGLRGWIQDWGRHTKPVFYRADGTLPQDEIRRYREAAIERMHREEVLRAKAAQEAAGIVQSCRWGPHPYLERKGFKQECGLVDAGGNLVIPMRDYSDYKKIQSVQRITAEGDKKFLLHGKAKGGVFFIGQGENWFCEGFATGLSVAAALASLYRRARVVVCFSAHNMTSVAREMGGRVVADNDESGVGEAAAVATGLPWCVPPTKDANDWHQSQGVRMLAALLLACLNKGTA